MAHTGLSAAFYLLHTTVGDSAMNKFGTCREVFTRRMLLFSVDNGAMNAPQCWQLSDDVAYSDIGTRADTRAALPREDNGETRLSQWHDEFHSHVGNLFPNCQELYGIFKGLSQDGGWVVFLKTSTPLSLIRAFWMNLISAGSISLDNTFIFGKESTTGFWQIDTSFTSNLSLQT